MIRKGVAPKLFEREADGTGILIHNHWTAADGNHFFVSADANGWEYVIPTIGSTDARATRLVYLGVTTSRQDGVGRPAGTPAIRCILALTHKKCSTPATGRVSATLKAGQEAFALGRYSALPFMQCVASPRGGILDDTECCTNAFTEDCRKRNGLLRYRVLHPMAPGDLMI